mmetsp:Transcript_24990/g.23969  ORF Transcript_24990/g.23969 Transcript_24990/m.23969 type:complete len:216 (-) Transcript_24990:114-761(-)|eukprot:CAMPEP_0119051364 /NCGR_PEP_ID=MMETSP1177-20130426/73009_1 /TAXON_ID=2985 /ORGANISM="Ochromonas sp, Strain CCMP1899" /LENGTH=215 /DNA_ID=CAMNT_0007030547 /DNA_START=170 /DNA_END=817 /DNA_ORIENTATION=+
MSIFDAYDQEFNSLCQEISKTLSELKGYSNSDVDKTSGLIRQCEGLLSQASDLFKQMEVEIRSHDPATRKALIEKVNGYKKSLLKHRSDFERGKEQAQRSSLIGDKSIEHRQKYLDVNDKVGRQNDMIANSLRTVAETEEVGLEITSELARNREKIQSSHGKVNEFAGITDSARRLLSSMARRDVKQRFILVFIAIVLIIAISVTIYFATKKPSK